MNFIDLQWIAYAIKSFIVKGNINERQLQATDETHETQVPHAYADLDGNKKEANVYDEVNVHNLSAFSDQGNLTKYETTAYIEMKNAKGSTKEKLEYINIKI